MITETFTYQQIAKAIEYLSANFQQQPTLFQVADHVHLSEYHFQRLFSEWAGVSPKKFLQYLTLEHAKEQLRRGESLAETAYQVGLSGTGRLHDLFVNIEGVTPGQFKHAGEDLLLQYGLFNSPFGEYILGAIDHKICKLAFLENQQDPEEMLAKDWPEATLSYRPEALRLLAESIFPSDSLLSVNTKTPLNLLVKGSQFQLKVWEALLRIPEGHLANYDRIAETIGMPLASRAVGTAIGQNPVGYLIPCHRVIKKTGVFGGYRWGNLRKTVMIGWEAARVGA